MTFDDLYGPGAWASFTGRLAAPTDTTVKATQTPIEDGVAVRFEWKAGERTGDAVAYHYPDRVQWVRHRAPMPGTLSSLVRSLGPWYREHGVMLMVMSSGGAPVGSAHRAVGFVTYWGGEAMLDLSDQGRGGEYLAWKNGKASRPGWRDG